MSRFRRIVVAALFLSAICLSHASFADGPPAKTRKAAVFNPYLYVIRDPDLHRELNLSTDQVEAIRRLTDELDGPLLSVRNKRPAEKARVQQELTERAQTRMATILARDQQQRLAEIVLQAQGDRALLRDDVAERLSLTDKQRTEIEEIQAETRKQIQELNRKQSDGSSQSRVRKLWSRQRKEILRVLSTTQRRRWGRLFGEPVDPNKFVDDQTFKAPEFHDSARWLNAQPLEMSDLRGQVVVVHFFAFG